MLTRFIIYLTNIAIWSIYLLKYNHKARLAAPKKEFLFRQVSHLGLSWHVFLIASSWNDREHANLALIKIPYAQVFCAILHTQWACIFLVLRRQVPIRQNLLTIPYPPQKILKTRKFLFFIFHVLMKIIIYKQTLPGSDVPLP